MKEKITRELDYALGGDVVGFVGVVVTKENGRVLPTVIDIAHSGLGKINSESIREKLRELGRAMAAECENVTCNNE